MCEVLVNLAKNIRNNGDSLSLISAETTYENISVDDINKIRSELTRLGIIGLPENSSELTDLYEKVVGKSYKPVSVQYSNTYRFARVRLFEKVMAQYFPEWKMEQKYKKWISFHVPEELK